MYNLKQNKSLVSAYGQQVTLSQISDHRSKEIKSGFELISLKFNNGDLWCIVDYILSCRHVWVFEGEPWRSGKAPCDREVMGSIPGNSLLQKCRERLRTLDPKWSDPSPIPRTLHKQELHAQGCPLGMSGFV
jgi:hypothetical protein